MKRTGAPIGRNPERVSPERIEDEMDPSEFAEIMVKYA